VSIDGKNIVVKGIFANAVLTGYELCDSWRLAIWLIEIIALWAAWLI
jgi:hypothetical protein